PRANDVIVDPLFHSSRPVAASSAYNTARCERCARWAAVIWRSVVWYSPLETAKTTLFRIIGASGDITSRDVQPCCNATLPFESTTLKATTELLAGAKTQRVAVESSHVASAPAAGSVAPAR